MISRSLCRSWLLLAAVCLLGLTRQATNLHVNARLSNVSAGTPTLVQSVATGMDQNPANDLQVSLPQQTLSGNAAILGVRFNSTGSISSVTDDAGNTWTAGPTATGSGQNFYNTNLAAYYVTNASPFRKVTIAFSGLNNNNGATPLSAVQAVLSEYYNVALSSALDGTGSSNTSRTTSSFSTTGVNDLVWHWAVDISDTDPNYGMTFDGSSITAGSGFTLQVADLQTGGGAQYQVKAAGGSISPTFSASGTSTWASVALALKSGTGGTAPSQTAMRIVHEQHSMIGWGPVQGTPITMAFPSTGTLLVGLYNASASVVTAITDNRSNSWQLPASALGTQGGTPQIAQIFYAQNASTDPTLSNIHFTISPSCGNGSVGDCNLVLYDITNGGFFDSATNTSGNQTTNPGSVTMATLTPINATGIVFHVGTIAFHTINGASGAGQLSDVMVNSYDDDNPGVGTATTNSRLDQDNGFSHQVYGTPSAITFTYTYNNRTDTSGVGGWAAAVAAFKQNVGGTFTATDCNRNSVNTLINGPTHTAVNGDTILIPAGTCTWTAGVTVPSNIGITIKGVGTPNATAATTGASATCSQTVLTDNVSGNYLFSFLPTVTNAVTRVSCLKINTTLGSNATVSPIMLAGTCTSAGCPSVRVDNVTFDGSLQGTISNSDTVMASDNVFGVLDHNTMTATLNGGLWEFVNFNHSAWQGVGASGDNSYASADTYGTSQALYVENNLFTDHVGHQIVPTEAESSVSRGGQGGGRIVARFNSCDGCYVGMANHGTDSNGRPRGGRQHEFYGNTFNCNTVCGGGNGVGLRSGTVLVFGNSFTVSNGGFFNSYLALATMRISVIFAAPWNQCPSTYDQSSPLLCADQPSRSGGTLLSGTTPSPTGWPNETLDPAYEWNDSGYDVRGAGQTSNASDAAGGQMVQNRDFYTDNSFGTPKPQTSATAPFNGTTTCNSGGSYTCGVGFGTKARRPTTCTTGVAYWATDEGNWNTSGNTFGQGNLYLCTATNTWTLSYTPYSYPHPVIQ